MDVTPLARTVLNRLVTVFGAAADAAKAGPRRAYLRDQFAFLGIPYARTDPGSVRVFVQAHDRVLSPLSVREALKNL